MSLYSNSFAEDREQWIPRLRRFLLWLSSRFYRSGLWTSHEDATCVVHCTCDHELFVTSDPSWCLNCGRGYRVNFVVESFPARLAPTGGLIRHYMAKEVDRYEKNKAMLVEHAGEAWADAGLRLGEMGHPRNMEAYKTALERFGK